MRKPYPLVELRLHHTFNWIRWPKDQLTKLVTLDLSITNIIDEDLIQILMANPNLEHLVLGSSDSGLPLNRITQ